MLATTRKTECPGSDSPWIHLNTNKFVSFNFPRAALGAPVTLCSSGTPGPAARCIIPRADVAKNVCGKVETAICA